MNWLPSAQLVAVLLPSLTASSFPAVHSTHRNQLDCKIYCSRTAWQLQLELIENQLEVVVAILSFCSSLCFIRCCCWHQPKVNFVCHQQHPINPKYIYPSPPPSPNLSLSKLYKLFGITQNPSEVSESDPKMDHSMHCQLLCWPVPPSLCPLFILPQPQNKVKTFTTF